MYTLSSLSILTIILQILFPVIVGSNRNENIPQNPRTAESGILFNKHTSLAHGLEIEYPNTAELCNKNVAIQAKDTASGVTFEANTSCDAYKAWQEMTNISIQEAKTFQNVESFAKRIFSQNCTLLPEDPSANDGTYQFIFLGNLSGSDHLCPEKIYWDKVNQKVFATYIYSKIGGAAKWTIKAPISNESVSFDEEIFQSIVLSR